jgi:hypothetical protein
MIKFIPLAFHQAVATHLDYPRTINKQKIAKRNGRNTQNTKIKLHKLSMSQTANIKNKNTNHPIAINITNTLFTQEDYD